MRPSRVQFLVVAMTLGVAAVAQAQAGRHGESREYNTALGVGCEHCHVEADWVAATKPTVDFARRMATMVRGLKTGAASIRQFSSPRKSPRVASAEAQ